MPYELRVKKIQIKDLESLKEPFLVSESIEDIAESIIIVNCLWGFGDSVYVTITFNAIYQELKRTYQQSGINKEPYFYAITPLPQIYSHLPYVRCLKPKPHDLRTQTKNLDRKDLSKYWHEYPVKKDKTLLVKLEANYFTYFGGHNWSVAENMLMPVISNAMIAWDLRRYDMQMTLPRFDVELPDWAKQPYILIRPNVIRKEWPAVARNCKPKYLKSAVRLVRQRLGIPIVSIADTSPGLEWVENVLPADYEYHKGEFNLEQMCELVHRATLCVGSQGWISPFSMAAKTKCVILLGGAGWENHPRRLTHPKLDTHTVKFIIPDNMCLCKGIHHTDCNKTIGNFDEKFLQIMQELGL